MLSLHIICCKFDSVYVRHNIPTNSLQAYLKILHLSKVIDTSGQTIDGMFSI